MFKRVMMIGLVAISVVLMLGTDAKAQNIWDVFFFWGSIDCRSLLNGLGKKAAPSTEVECIAVIKEFVGTCRNHGGNADSSGSHIFQLQTGAVVGTSIQATGCTLDKESGKWICNESITDEQLQDELGQAIGD